MRLLKYNQFNESKKTRTRELTEEEFLNLFKENCKNYSYTNDQLFRGSRSTYEFSLFIKEKRARTLGIEIGDPYGGYKGYSSLFKSIADDIKNFPVERTKSLIGVTDNCDFIDWMFPGHNCKLVIPYDGTQIVISPVPDIGMIGRVSEMTKDDFIMVTYDKNFTIPREELIEIRNRRSSFRPDNDPEMKNFGFEFFTNGPCLLIDNSKIDLDNWLRSIVD